MPTRGGARGGAAEFSWDKVKESKDREFYLGNSVAAPTGRWQDGRDINWYNKDASTSSSAAADERREELRKIKQAETAALYAKLGKPPPAPRSDDGLVKVGERLASGSAGAVRREVTGANGAPLEGNKSRTWGKGSEEAEELSEADKKLARKFARNEVRRRRAETGEDNGERRRSRKDEESRHHSSGRRRRDDDEDRERRHAEEAAVAVAVGAGLPSQAAIIDTAITDIDMTTATDQSIRERRMRKIRNTALHLIESQITVARDNGLTKTEALANMAASHGPEEGYTMAS
ncbi:uncharacterized protein UBRO2_01032 [Ustilago bromivora]|uniref:Multiple myeloma tumor-associated protein 2-like N-terminal domain-containing protein n=1 Tax=Ustilago bromivora TaxID=307758 RepID=A0A8H8QI85_9BASI|nr:uncharacterized protein UBRO2_01032 [Ustilago bromivora]